MSSATFTWTLPTLRESGGPLDPADIDRTEIAMSADDGANFTPTATVVPTDEQTWTVSELVFGDYIVRFVVIDTQGRASTPFDFPFTALDDSAPGTVQNVQVSLS